VIAVLAGDGEDVKAAGQGLQARRRNLPRLLKHLRSRRRHPHLRRFCGEGRSTGRRSCRAPSDGARSTNQRSRPHLLIAAADGCKGSGIELARINGSGPHGRVIARDVEQAKSGKGLKAPAAAPAGAPAIAPGMSDKQIRALYEDGSYEVIPHDGMRRTIDSA